MKNKRRKWRIIPVVSYTNWKKQAGYREGLWKRWFLVQRFWSGRIIDIQVKHHMLSLDFRYSWLADLMNK